MHLQVSLEEFSNAVEQRKPRRLEQDRRGDSLSGSNAWSTILAKIDENPQAWQRSVQVLFRTFDRDGSGQVDVSELAAGLKSMGLDLAPDMVMALRDELDAVRDCATTIPREIYMLWSNCLSLSFDLVVLSLDHSSDARASLFTSVLF